MVRAMCIMLFCFAPNFVQDTGPKAVLSGPSKKVVGKLVAIKSIGSVGSDMKFFCTPRNDDWQAVRFDDNSLGILFSTDTPGKYTFILAVASKDGKVDLAILDIEITSTKLDPSKSDPFTKALFDAYKLDIASGADHKKILSDIYRNAATITCNDRSLTKPQQIFDTMRIMAQKAIPVGSLPSLRAAISNQEKLLLKINASTPLTDDLRSSLSSIFMKISNALDSF